ncbi:MAG: peptide-methionine (S)-S-oxide reductase [Thalassobium sp.]|nr:MAG: peptide-methionine (S)-S-oxide reductase [Thalassobium sp.]
MWRPKLMSIPTADQALPGRAESLYQVPQQHHVNGNRIGGERPAGLSEVLLGMGCFWGAERKFWSLPGVYSTAVGYGAGHTLNPTYEEVCGGMTGHNELVRVWFDEQQLPLEQLLAVFWESHDPTQGMRQGNDIGTQYRSGIYLLSEADRTRAESTKAHYQQRLQRAGMGDITTEILVNVPFYLAEGYHQQYLAKNPNGYCGLGGCNVSFD